MRYNTPMTSPLSDDRILSGSARSRFGSIWNSLSQSEQQSLLSLVKGLPGDAGGIRGLLKLASTQVKQAFGKKSRIAIVGPANVGKSTLYNQFIQAKAQLAEVGPLPGTTRRNQEVDAGVFILVDTPGADAVGQVGENERQEALRAASQADFLIILFDAIQGIKQTELDLFHMLSELDKPCVVALNKIDLVRKHRSQVVEQAARNLGLAPDQVIPVVAKDGKNLDQLLAAVVMVEPELTASLGAALPQYRWQLAWKSTVSAASASAVIALTPLPFLDFFPLVAIQSVMVLGIARIYRYEINLERARELVVTFGLGFLGRTLFMELSKLGGIPGWVLSAAVAASVTVAMGYAAVAWFEKGERLSSETLGQLTRKLTGQMLDGIRRLGSKKPNEIELREAVEKALTSEPPTTGNKPPQDADPSI